METPRVSFIIPTLNEQNNIAQCIQSIISADYPNDQKEIIVVDTGSTDNTLQIVKKFKEIKLYQVLEKIPTASRGLNFGMKVSSGDFIQYVAADCKLDKNWIKVALGEFNRDTTNKLMVVGGLTKEIRPKDSIFKYLLNLGFKAGECENGFVIANAGSGLIKREVLSIVKGYNPNLVSEDEIEFGIRINDLGYLYKKIPHPMVYHDLGLKNNFRGLLATLKRAWRQGIGLGQITFLHKNSKTLKKYLQSISRYRIAFFVFYLIIISLLVSFLYPILFYLFIPLGILFSFFGIMQVQKKYFKLNKAEIILLSIWYLIISQFMFLGYYYFLIFKPLKYQIKHET